MKNISLRLFMVLCVVILIGFVAIVSVYINYADVMRNMYNTREFYLISFVIATLLSVGAVMHVKAQSYQVFDALSAKLGGIITAILISPALCLLLNHISVEKSSVEVELLDIRGNFMSRFGGIEPMFAPDFYTYILLHERDTLLVKDKELLYDETNFSEIIPLIESRGLLGLEYFQMK